MSSRERSSKSSSLNGIRDIGTFVENYGRLIKLCRIINN